MTAAVRIIGIDPGSRVTGYGIVDSDGRRHRYVDSGCIRVGSGALAERLRRIFDGVSELLARFSPDESAIERVFMNKNADSALKLGQARGAAICALAGRGLAVQAYSPREIKQAVTGAGGAAKQQVQYMVTVMLRLERQPPTDAADALAVALCHAHQREARRKLALATGGGVAGPGG